MKNKITILTLILLGIFFSGCIFSHTPTGIVISKTISNEDINSCKYTSSNSTVTNEDIFEYYQKNSITDNKTTFCNFCDLYEVGDTIKFCK